MLDSSGTVQVPLISGNIINIPVERITVTTQPEINISEEMSKTMLWKTIVANESSNSLTNLEAAEKKKWVPVHAVVLEPVLRLKIRFKRQWFMDRWLVRYTLADRSRAIVYVCSHDEMAVSDAVDFICYSLFL